MTNISENIKDIDNRLYYDFNSLCLMIGEDNVPYQFKIISDENKLVHKKVKYVSESQTYILIIRNNLDRLYREVFEAFKSFGVNNLNVTTTTTIPVEVLSDTVTNSETTDSETTKSTSTNEKDNTINDLTRLHKQILKKRDNHVENLVIFIESNV